MRPKLLKFASYGLIGIIVISALIVTVVLSTSLIKDIRTRRKVYSALSFLPYQRDVTQVKIADSYFADKQYAQSIIHLTKAKRMAPKVHTCIIDIKLGDSNYNLASTVTTNDEKLHYLQASIDNYGQCLDIHPTDDLAHQHKTKAEAELKRIQTEQTEQNNSQSNNQNSNNSGDANSTSNYESQNGQDGTATNQINL